MIRNMLEFSVVVTKGRLVEKQKTKARTARESYKI